MQPNRAPPVKIVVIGRVTDWSLTFRLQENNFLLRRHLLPSDVSHDIRTADFLIKGWG